jgi:chromosome segregation ATPase
VAAGDPTSSKYRELGLVDQRQLLDTERERGAALEDQARQDAAQFRQFAAEALAGRETAELRFADLELLLSQRQTQIEDLQLQREVLLCERGETQQQNLTLQQDLQELRLKAERERVAQKVYVREVDHAREEGKAMAAQSKAVNRQVEQLQRRLESIQNELSQTQQRAVAQHARAETLELQLTQVRQVPAAKRKPRTRKPTASKSDPSG